MISDKRKRKQEPDVFCFIMLYCIQTVTEACFVKVLKTINGVFKHFPLVANCKLKYTFVILLFQTHLTVVILICALKLIHILFVT